MGTSQSTARAAKFSGSTRRRVTQSTSAPPSTRMSRRCHNTNRSVKEFSRYFSDDHGASFRRKHRSSSTQNSRAGSFRRGPSPAVSVTTTEAGRLSPYRSPGTPQPTPRSARVPSPCALRHHLNHYHRPQETEILN